MLQLHEEVSAIEDEIDALARRAERCRKLALVARAAVWLGGGVLALSLVGVLRLPPLAFVLALTALIGGIPLAGSTQSTLDETKAALVGAEARRRALIDALLGSSDPGLGAPGPAFGSRGAIRT